jgi:hypothetical protein
MQWSIVEGGSIATAWRVSKLVFEPPGPHPPDDGLRQPITTQRRPSGFTVANAQKQAR